MTLAKSTPTTLLPITDYDRAKTFYADALMLPFAGTNLEGSLLFDLAGGSTLALMQRPAGAQADHTALSFNVSDVYAAIADLEGRGVTFEDYDGPDLKTVDHVADFGSERAAWFKDPDGNYLCLHQTS